MSDEFVAVWGGRVILVLMWACIAACVAFVGGYAPVKHKVDVGRHMMRTSVLFGFMFGLTILFHYVDVPVTGMVLIQIVVFGAAAAELWYRVALMFKHRRLARERARAEMRARLALVADGPDEKEQQHD